MGLLFITFFLTGFIAYQSIHWSPPRLPETELSGLSVSLYLNSIRKLPDARPDNPVGISLSPEETSFLLENIDLNVSRSGFRLVDVYLDNDGEMAQVQMIFQGPIGFYYRSDFQGIIRYSNEDSQWTVTTREFWFGALPLRYWVGSEFHPDWSTNVLSERVKLQDLRLDGKGLRMSVTGFEVDLESLVDI
jgi:hypothetical protein